MAESIKVRDVKTPKIEVGAVEPFEAAGSAPGAAGRSFPAGCPSRVLLDHVTSLWGVLVLAVLSEGTARWSELRRRVEGVSEKMLAQTLRTLVADGLVARIAHPEVPPRVEYHLTPDGEELVGLLLPLVDWTQARAGAGATGR